MKLHCFVTDKPRKNSRFVAFSSDMGGASLYKCDKNGVFYDSEGVSLECDSDWFFDAGYLLYAYLPKDARLFFEGMDK